MLELYNAADSFLRAMKKIGIFGLLGILWISALALGNDNKAPHSIGPLPEWAAVASSKCMKAADQFDPSETWTIVGAYKLSDYNIYLHYHTKNRATYICNVFYGKVSSFDLSPYNS